MSTTIIKALRAEISRLSRKEARVNLEPVKKQGAQMRQAIAEIKRRLDELERCVKLCATDKPQAAVKADVAQRKASAKSSAKKSSGGWITGKGVRRMRAAMKLSQSEFAALAGVTPKAVSLWEGNDSVLKVRQKTKESLFGLRGVGVREAKRRLQELGIEVAKPAAAKAPKAKPAPAPATTTE